MTQRIAALIVAALCLLFPAWADVTATIGMTTSTTLDLDTGAIGTGAAADIVYTGPGGIAPLGSSTLLTIFNGTGTATFNGLTQANLVALTTYSSAQLPDFVLKPGVIIAARTKTGKYSKLLVANNVSGTLVLTFNTFTANPVGPTIVSVQNNYGQIDAGLPNSALAPGSLIFVKGTNLSPVNDGQSLRSSASPGLQNTISGVSVTVTVNGISLNCPLYYLSPRQINAVLPGNTPIGSGTVFVTNNQDKSATFSITVAQSSFGILNYNGSLAATYDANNALITRLNAANPGQTIVIWGSGVGSDAANDDRLFPQKTNNLVNVPMQVLVGGRVATILYRGRSQFPGLDQIVVTLPFSGPTGCYVPLSVITGNIVSNGVTIPVAASGKTCADPNDPLTPAIIQTLSAKATTNVASITLARVSTPGATYTQAQGKFQTTNGFGLTAGNGSVSVGNCLTSVGGGYNPIHTSAPLDAGPGIQVTQRTGPLSLTMARKVRADSTDYEADSVPQGLFPVAGSDLILESSPGGPDVSRFSTAVPLPSNFSWTNSAALNTIDRQGATVTWSGGSGAAYVLVNGSVSSSETHAYASFSCLANASAGQFTIPSYVLMAMPPNQGDLTLSAVGQQYFSNAFGLDFATMLVLIGAGRSANY